jgi:putative FmdB family regulatory protein
VPIYEYKAKDAKKSCKHCSEGFEHLQIKISDPPLEKCPECGGAIEKQISAPSVGGSKSGFDDRAKNAGFSKLKKISKGEYEKEY